MLIDFAMGLMASSLSFPLRHALKSFAKFHVSTPHWLHLPPLVLGLRSGCGWRDCWISGLASLTLFKNGWRVLDSLAVGAELRRGFHFLPVQQFKFVCRMVMKSVDGRELGSFSFDKEAPGGSCSGNWKDQRRVLLETLASNLPSCTISYSSKVKSVKAQGKEGTLLKLEDGREILAKLVIGCDGVNSPIAKWMGFPDAKFVGHCAFRGMAHYPDGQSFKSKVNYIYGRGLRLTS